MCDSSAFVVMVGNLPASQPYINELQKWCSAHGPVLNIQAFDETKTTQLCHVHFLTPEGGWNALHDLNGSFFYNRQITAEWLEPPGNFHHPEMFPPPRYFGRGSGPRHFQPRFSNPGRGLGPRHFQPRFSNTESFPSPSGHFNEGFAKRPRLDQPHIGKPIPSRYHRGGPGPRPFQPRFSKPEVFPSPFGQFSGSAERPRLDQPNFGKPNGVAKNSSQNDTWKPKLMKDRMQYFNANGGFLVKETYDRQNILDNSHPICVEGLPMGCYAPQELLERLEVYGEVLNVAEVLSHNGALQIIHYKTEQEAKNAVSKENDTLFNNGKLKISLKYLCIFQVCVINLPNVTHEDVQKEMIERFSKHGRLVKVKNEKGFYLSYASSESKWNAINHENGTMFHDQPLIVQPGERILKSKHVVYKSLKHPHLGRRYSRTSVSADDYASRFLEVKNLPQDEYEPQELLDRFAVHGEIVNAKEVNSLGSPSCNYLLFKTNQQADNAVIKENNSLFENKTIAARMLKTKESVFSVCIEHLPTCCSEEHIDQIIERFSMYGGLVKANIDFLSSGRIFLTYRLPESAWNAIKHENGSFVLGDLEPPISVTSSGRLKYLPTPSDDQLASALKKTIVISNLPQRYIRRDLADRFSVHGQIRCIEKCKKLKQDTGACFLVYSSCKKAQIAINKENNSTFMGNTIKVSLSASRNEVLLDELRVKKEPCDVVDLTEDEDIKYDLNPDLSIICVGNLPQSLSQQQKQQFINQFSVYGQVLNEEKICVDKKRNCYVEYLSPASAWNAIKLENGNLLFKGLSEMPIYVIPVGSLVHVSRPSDEQLTKAMKRSIIVTNLPKNFTKAGLIKRFSAYGKIVNKKNIHAENNSCILVYSTGEEAENAECKQNISIFLGNYIEVCLAETLLDHIVSKKETPNQHVSQENETATQVPHVNTPRIGIFVENLDPEVNVHELLHLFSGFGEILNSRELMSWDFGQEYCIVQYKELRECEEAISVCNKELFKDRVMFVGFRCKKNIKQKDLTDVKVSGLNPYVNAQDILKHFSPYGDILNHQKLSHQRYFGERFCLISYRTIEECQNAVKACNNVSFRNKILSVELRHKYVPGKSQQTATISSLAPIIEPPIVEPPIVNTPIIEPPIVEPPIIEPKNVEPPIVVLDDVDHDDDGAVNSNAVLAVSNLAPNVDVFELLWLFTPYGEVVNSQKLLAWDFAKGVCSVVYSTQEECRKAILELDKSDFNGRILRVEMQS